MEEEAEEDGEKGEEKKDEAWLEEEEEVPAPCTMMIPCWVLRCDDEACLYETG